MTVPMRPSSRQQFVMASWNAQPNASTVVNDWVNSLTCYHGLSNRLTNFVLNRKLEVRGNIVPAVTTAFCRQFRMLCVFDAYPEGATITSNWLYPAVNVKGLPVDLYVGPGKRFQILCDKIWNLGFEDGASTGTHGVPTQHNFHFIIPIHKPSVWSGDGSTIAECAQGALYLVWLSDAIVDHEYVAQYTTKFVFSSA